ncbi:heme o synthase [Gulosibacter chungangensis]|uniref:Protoheme IX farnesyltransferase n=1 Tax=Gulosibacter chungangensis TaxID=979746 RepID=A0A7J5BF16_9MICO|nr:heme o synthase [Gulosibacter chungangensis]KAB1644254.1 protoheme IX farnesyltransferase [Gulosibacter chungangensis]
MTGTSQQAGVEVSSDSVAPERSILKRKLAAYVSLTKPRIIELLLVTTLPTMFLAAKGLFSPWLALGVLVGGSLSAASANVFNCYIDRDIDKVMRRTKNRPLVTGEVTPRESLILAWVLGIASTALLWAVANPLTAALSVGAILLYVVLYTLILKRRTDQNIVWGGVAGCMPVLIGWASVTNSLSWEPLILFLVIFLWTPAHYWPLSVKYVEDYEKADVPMLSVTMGEGAVALQSVIYAWATVIASLLLIPIAPMGWIYTIAAVGSGLWFIGEAHRLYYDVVKDNGEAKPMRVFHLSITYLTLVFLGVGLDPIFFFPLY